MSGPSREPLVKRTITEQNGAQPANDWETETVSSVPRTLSLSGGLTSIEDGDEGEHDAPRSAVEALNHAEGSTQPGPSSSPSPLQTERGAAWLRDQSSRTLKSLLGDGRAPSDMDDFSLNDTGSIMSGELALHKDPRGKFYYAYTSGGLASEPSIDDAASFVYHADGSGEDGADLDERDPRPSSRDLKWLHEQTTLLNAHSEPHRPSTSQAHHVNHRSYSEPILSREDIPPELLPFISLPLEPPKNPTDCSNCGALLETIRYVCATCGEKEPPRSFASAPLKTNGHLNCAKGKRRDFSPASSNSDILYPPRPMASSASASSWTLLASDNENPFHDSKAINKQKPLPALPTAPSSPGSSPSSLTIPGMSVGGGHSTASQESGYELCHQCIESVGVVHALESCIAPGSSPILGEWPPSPEDAQRALSAWRRTASAKGQLRHAYIEKVWGASGWANVGTYTYIFPVSAACLSIHSLSEHDDHFTVKCSTCPTTIVGKRYKCAMCDDFNLCKACYRYFSLCGLCISISDRDYSQVHEIHPSHAFLVILEKPPRSHSEPVIEHPTLTPDETGELCMCPYN